MKILFVGQRGIPIFGNKGQVTREKRVELLATELARQGHTVVAMCAKPFVFPSISRYNGVELMHRGSVTYTNSVNIWHLSDTVLYLRSYEPDVVHAHGWRAGLLIKVMHLVHPSASYIWTIDTLPERYSRLASFVARMVTPLCDAVVAPTRQLQYLLLQFLKIRTVYIPDGYMGSQIPVLPLSRFSLRANQYSVTTASTREDIRFVAQGYKRVGTKKPLLVFTADADLHRMKRYFPFLTFIADASARVQSTLIAGAAAVIVAGSTTSSDVLLSAMDAGRAIVATTEPLYEEVLGVTARFVKYNDGHGLTDALQKVVKDIPFQKELGLKAQKRARMHFRAPRILSEYMITYCAAVVRPVPMDSALPKLASSKSL